MIRPSGQPAAVYLAPLDSNHDEWAAGSVCDLYKARWEIEVFFKQVKQTLRLSGFLGYSANAIRWQVWTALLVYVLLRFAAHLSQWAHKLHAALCGGAGRVMGAAGCPRTGQQAARSSCWGPRNRRGFPDSGHS